MNCEEARNALFRYYNEGGDVETAVEAYEHIFVDLQQKIAKCEDCRTELEEKIKKKCVS